MIKQDNFRYALIPISYLNYQKNAKYKIFTLKAKIMYHLFKKISFKTLKIISIAVKIEASDKPYIEEVLTKNKIGLTKKSGYKVYLSGDIIYKICTKDEIYKIINSLKYKMRITKVFS